MAVIRVPNGRVIGRMSSPDREPEKNEGTPPESFRWFGPTPPTPVLRTIGTLVVWILAKKKMLARMRAEVAAIGMVKPELREIFAAALSQFVPGRAWRARRAQLPCAPEDLSTEWWFRREYTVRVRGVKGRVPVVAGYLILRKLGEGGLGTVYQAVPWDDLGASFA